jgi:putative transposase
LWGAIKTITKGKKMSYPSDVTDKQWELIKAYFVYGRYGKYAKHPKRYLVNAVLYITKTGCQWRQLPQGFPHWKTVYSFYHRAKKKGIWEKVLRALVAQSRAQQGRNPEPSFSLIDSQSVKTTGNAKTRGFDGGKKVKGRKRHIVTDTEGHLLHVEVHAANTHDTIAGGRVFRSALEKYPTLQGVCADAGYRGTTVDFVCSVLNKTIEISKRVTSEWAVLAKRWVVERTFAWLNGFRRLAKDFEITLSSAENYVIIAHSMTLLKRFA